MDFKYPEQEHHTVTCSQKHWNIGRGIPAIDITKYFPLTHPTIPGSAYNAEPQRFRHGVKRKDQMWNTLANGAVFWAFLRRGSWVEFWGIRKPASDQVCPAFQKTASRWGRSMAPSCVCRARHLHQREELLQNLQSCGAEPGSQAQARNDPPTSFFCALEAIFPSEPWLPAEAHLPTCRCTPGLWGSPSLPHLPADLFILE